jgi:hypothetical protein
MAKKFMFVCFGILALVIAFHLGAQYGQAGYVDHSATGIIATNNAYHYLMENGDIYSFNEIAGWGYEGAYSLPVPVSQVKFWVDKNHFISTADEIWLKGGVSQDWINWGAPPGAAPAQSSTWGEIKAEFGE